MSGAKFQDRKFAYKICSGLHGVGLIVVNALSSYYKIEIYRNKKHAVYEFDRSKLKESEIKTYTDQPPFSTKIEFIPDKKFFDTLEPDIKRIRNRLTTASAEMPKDVRFVLIVDNKQEVFQLDVTQYFIRRCITTKDVSYNAIFRKGS